MKAKPKYTYAVSITELYEVESDKEFTDDELLADGLGDWTHCGTESNVETLTAE